MWKSYAEWPEGVYTNEYGKNISSDTHKTEEEANGVCRMLHRIGFAGTGKHFPLKTWVEKIEHPATSKAQNDTVCLGKSTCGGCSGEKCYNLAQ